MSEIKITFTYPNRQRLEICQGDLTAETTGAIVNAANSSLVHGGGIAAVIAGKGGEIIDRESAAWVRQHGPVSHDKPAYTSAGRLPCRYVIHAVGPVWGEGDEDARLAAAINGSLARAEELDLTSLAFPAISTGIFRFPRQRAAGVFYRTLLQYYQAHPTSPLTLVRIVLFDAPTLDAFLEEFKLWSASQKPL
jgi:O-acetyl-ADP-ribose deacetylase